MANKIGPLIKEARTAAGLTQEQLARKVAGVAAADISKAERGELQLSQEALKKIAKATGVTQTSLLEAAKKSTYAAKTTTAKTAAKSTAKTTSTAAKSTMQVTAAERKLVEAYRNAGANDRKAALRILKGESDTATELISSLLENSLGTAVERMVKK